MLRVVGLRGLGVVILRRISEKESEWSPPWVFGLYLLFLRAIGVIPTLTCANMCAAFGNRFRY